jgi:hypothetical protein
MGAYGDAGNSKKQVIMDKIKRIKNLQNSGGTRMS